MTTVSDLITKANALTGGLECRQKILNEKMKVFETDLEFIQDELSKSEKEWASATKETAPSLMTKIKLNLVKPADKLAVIEKNITADQKYFNKVLKEMGTLEKQLAKVQKKLKVDDPDHDLALKTAEFIDAARKLISSISVLIAITSDKMKSLQDRLEKLETNFKLDKSQVKMDKSSDGFKKGLENICKCYKDNPGEFTPARLNFLQIMSKKHAANGVFLQETIQKLSTPALVSTVKDKSGEKDEKQEKLAA